MKKHRIYIFSTLFLSFSLIFSACEEKDDYDYDAIVPEILAINGPAEVTAHGITDFPVQFDVPYRGGSTYEWSAASPNGDATIVIDEEYESIANITFPQTDVAQEGTITVVETTYAGKQSEPYSRSVVLNPFCPYPMEEYVGEYTGTETAHAETVVAELGDNLNELIMYGLADFVQTSWGENWTEGDGSCVLEFSCGDVVTIPYQYIGDSDFPDTYYIEGAGTVDTENKVISIEYEVFYTGGSVAGIVTDLTLDGAALKVYQEFTAIKK